LSLVVIADHEAARHAWPTTEQTAPAGTIPAGAACRAFHFQPPTLEPADWRKELYSIPTKSLYQSVVWDFGRVMGSHQALLRMS